MGPAWAPMPGTPLSWVGTNAARGGTGRPTGALGSPCPGVGESTELPPQVSGTTGREAAWHSPGKGRRAPCLSDAGSVGDRTGWVRQASVGLPTRAAGHGQTLASEGEARPGSGPGLLWPRRSTQMPGRPHRAAAGPAATAAPLRLLVVYDQGPAVPRTDTRSARTALVTVANGNRPELLWQSSGCPGIRLILIPKEHRPFVRIFCAA